MKLLKIINNMNQNEISKFYNILTKIISELGKSITLDKSTDAEHFVKTFNKEEINKKYKEEVAITIRNDLFLDITTDIVIRDGNCIMSRDWFKKLLEKELREITKRTNEFKKILKLDTNEEDITRIRDYKIYKDCIFTALNNDLERNAEAKITSDETSILYTLKKSLGLSNDESRSIFFNTVGLDQLQKYDVDEIIAKIKDCGLGFYKNKERTLYIPEEFISMLRDIKNVKLANKYTRRILKSLDDKIINKIKKRHGIKEIDRHEKIESIIKKGLGVCRS